MILQLFFLDSEPSANVASFLSAPQSDDLETASDGSHPVAWVDSDDERIIVSLDANPRLRKLRRTGSEDIVNGKEYVERLRRQYERLHPVPLWARQSTTRPELNTQRRRLDLDTSDGFETSSEDELPDSIGELSVQPLARLLQDTATLTNLSRTADPHKKLRPEIIDVHRLNDVGEIKPVRPPRNFHLETLT